MGKFDNLENKLDKVVNKASLKSKNDKNTKNILIYNVPVEWTEILKENGISFSSYAKMAILEKMKKDGLV
ncbi:hypothetical protein [Nitrosophilus labii]|uniref:hypothetical protein n=1 Tax=Nitrosophilus labii TaxID=2706014 RepID=UPI001656F6B5|nr:hypothetical protein [Nitrosophilus labii]